MNSNDLSIYPIVNCCSALLADADTYVRELIFTYCRKTCKYCPLVNKSIRKMSPGTVVKHIQEAVRIAQSKQLSKVRIQLIGGDALGAWDEFSEVCKLVRRTKWDLPVSLGAVICGCGLTQEKQEWLLENSRSVQLAYRWDEITGKENWMHYPLLRHPMVECVQWFVAPSTIPQMYSELSVLLRYGKKIQLEFFALESWSSDDYAAFFSQLGKLIIAEYYSRGPHVLRQFGLDYPEHCHRQLETVDVTGDCYRCRYLSPERMIYSTLTRYYSKKQESKTCDAAKEVLARRTACKVLSAYYTEFLQKLSQLLDESVVDAVGCH